MTKKEPRYEMIESMYKILNAWLSLKENDRTISDILLENDIHSVYIYGAGAMMVHLMEDLKRSTVNVLGIIDKVDGFLYDGTNVLKIEGITDKADAIIYTNPKENNNVVIKLKDYCRKVLSIEDIVFDVLSE
ncbi:hypothetical protein [Butyrivibrio sp. WCD2001]|uniref:hypothetical protein n=1 Tax=Butyrivibrio sp. WCD2001 TaxID=1280681 RepID=UPI0003F67378|nr:hypothetical protein [Butyrivibrio sp. WCD2001]